MAGTDTPRDKLRLRLEVMTGTRLDPFDDLHTLSRSEWQDANRRYAGGDDATAHIV